MTATITPISHHGGAAPGVTGTFWTLLARTWGHAPDAPCEQPGRVWQTPWRRVQGAAEDTDDRGALDARAEAMRARAVPECDGSRCSHVEVAVAPAAMNAPKDVKRVIPQVAARLGV